MVLRWKYFTKKKKKKRLNFENETRWLAQLVRRGLSNARVMDGFRSNSSDEVGNRTNTIYDPLSTKLVP